MVCFLLDNTSQKSYNKLQKVLKCNKQKDVICVLKKLNIYLSAIILSLILLISLYPAAAQAATSNEIKEQIEHLDRESDELSEKIKELENALSGNAAELSEMVKQKGAIDRQIVLLNEQIENTDQRILSYGILLADKQEELYEAESRLMQLREKSKIRIREMEERGSMSYWSVLFEATTFSDFLDRVMMIQELSEADARCIKELSDATYAVEKVQKELENEKVALQLVKTQQTQQKNDLTSKRAEADAILQKLMENADEYQQLLSESEEKQEQLMAQIAQKENEYDRLAYEEWLATSIPETTEQETIPELESQTKPSEPYGESDVVWHQPLTNYTVVSPFGMRLHPILGIYRMHNGVDLSSPMDTPIYATRSGVVSVADHEDDGAGNYIQINHGDGYRSVYMHMTRYIVSLGESVQAGQLIGYVGSTGLSDGPHLHFGISYNGKYINPMEFIG